MDGFGGNPLDKESWWMMTTGMVNRASNYGVDGDVILMAKHLGMENYAMQMLRGLKTFYIFDSGGYVKKARLANPGKKNVRGKNNWIETDELGAARKAAEAGYKIYFLPKVKQHGISDLDIIADNDLADIKHVFTPTASAVTEAMKRAKGQRASTILLEVVTPDLTIDIVEPLVRKQLGSHIKKAIVLLGGKAYSFPK